METGKFETREALETHVLFLHKTTKATPEKIAITCKVTPDVIKTILSEKLQDTPTSG